MTVEPSAGTIRPIDFGSALSERYLAYALSTITSRSLPDVRDGLKPVHRRLLYAMRELGLNPASGFKKCARVVGDVMGKYHPHGDAAIYDAMVRLAQEFAVRYPLVDGHGNFGNIDGDNPAAMRYTEARLTAIAEALLAGIDEDAVDFRDTYDGEGQEPVVLPAAFPNLLANGAQGIAVGMATSIPPHNAGEVCAALQHLIANPAASTAELVGLIRGPDFPTGGVLCESREAIVDAYEKGRGSFRVRARWSVEELGRGVRHVVVTEIPYQVPKARLVERLAQIVEDKKLPILEEVRDESTEDVRVVLVPRSRLVDPAALMEALFRQTDLEVRIGLNMNVLRADGTPEVMGLRDVLRAFLDHRQVVLVRRSRHRLAAIARRLEVLDGLLIVYANLDEVIRIIREADDARAALMARFMLNEVQADAILNMRLRALRKLEEIELRREHAKLLAERKELDRLLADERRQWKRIGEEIGEIRKKFGEDTAVGRRRTEIAEAPVAVEIAPESYVEREPVTVVLTEKGWIRAIKGHIAPDAEVRHREGDQEVFRLHAQTTDRLVAFASDGRAYTLAPDRLPGGRGLGEPIRLMIDLADQARIMAFFVHRPETRLLVASSDGRGFLVAADEVLAQTRQGRQVMNLAAGAELARVVPVPPGADRVAVIGENRKLLVFALADLPEMTRGRGVMLQRYRDGGLGDVAVFAAADGLAWAQGERVRRETNLAAWEGARGAAGKLPPHGFPRTGRFGEPPK